MASEVEARLAAIAEVLPSIQRVDSAYVPVYSKTVSQIRCDYLEIVREQKTDGLNEDQIDGLYRGLKPDEKLDAVNGAKSQLEELNQATRTDARNGGVNSMTARRKNRALPGMEK